MLILENRGLAYITLTDRVMCDNITMTNIVI